ncbi:MAG: hypothetical protein AB7J13_03970, partial [Pyrinomonadaceae bacterium]
MKNLNLFFSFLLVGLCLAASLAFAGQGPMRSVERAYDLQMTGSEELVEGTSRYQVLTANDKGNGGVSKVYFNIDM